MEIAEALVMEFLLAVVATMVSVEHLRLGSVSRHSEMETLEE